MRGIYVFFIICILCQEAFPQPYISRNNYSGNWETPESWNPVWTVPSTTLSGTDITINGNITVSSSLSLSGTACSLIINDTLVINGDLSLGNNVTLTINDNGVLIVRGKLTMDNKTALAANAYLIVMGDVDFVSSAFKGSFTSNDNPVKVFIGGAISSSGLTDYTNYPVLNCTDPVTIPYPNSGCSYGNMEDLMNDPIYSLFHSTCANATASSNSPVCAGDTISLTSSGGTGYSWNGPGGFTSIIQNPGIPNADIEMAGEYIVTVTSAGCKDTDTTNVIVNALPIATAGNNGPVCAGNTINLTASGGTGYSWNGPGGFTSIIQNPSIPNATVSTAGIYTVMVATINGCSDTVTQSVLVNEYPVAIAGPDQELDNVYETQMKAALFAHETGEWSLISGSGNIQDIHSPTTGITELSGGENIFLWTVSNGNCTVNAAVKIIVSDLFIPSVITPNGDVKNEYFIIRGGSGQVELVIFNQWGNVEYSNDNYLNDWNGRNNKGKDLPNDTYFYVAKFKNGEIKKGSVLIKR
jgi:gliding motility-associated-like protein